MTLSALSLRCACAALLLALAAPIRPADAQSSVFQATLSELRGKGVEVARDVSDQGWGLLAAIRLPDGSEFSIYEPRHPSPSLP